MTWLNKSASGAVSHGKSIRRARTTTRVKVAEHANSRRSQTAYPGMVASLRTWLRQSMRMETKFYLVSGLAGIVIASMARTLSEGQSKVNAKPTEESWLKEK